MDVRALLLKGRVVAGILVASLMPAAASGQTPKGEPQDIPRWEVGPYVGVSRHSLAGRYLGLIPDRTHVFVGLQLTDNLLRRKRWALAYAPEIVPLLVVSNNPISRSVSTRSGVRFTVVAGSGPVTGFAISPIGIQTQMKMSAKWRAYAGSAAGVVWFTRAVPVVESRAFNYTFEFGGGVRWDYRPRESLRVGFKLHHLSNAYTAERNPGLDAAVVLVGYERALGRSK